MRKGILVGIVMLILATAVLSLTFNDLVQTDFDEGTYFQVFFNDTYSKVQLNDQTEIGNYTSQVFDASQLAQWENLSWDGNTGAILVAVDNAEEVYKSNDLGGNWTLTNDAFNGGGTNAIEIVASSNGILYLVDSSADLWESSDFGNTWTLIKDDYNDGETNNPQVMSIDHFGNLFIFEGDEDVWSSTNSGVDWNKVNDDYDSGTSGSAPQGTTTNSSGAVFVVANDANVYVSTDVGVTWTLVKDDYNGGDGNSADDMASDSNDFLYIARNEEIWKSQDAGVSWTQMTTDFNPGDNNNIIALTSDKEANLYSVDASEDIFKSTDFGATWELMIENFNGGSGNVISITSYNQSPVTFQVRSDGDNSDWGNFIGPDGTGLSYFTNSTLSELSIDDNQYFQYAVYFETDDLNYTPELYNVSVEYTLLDITPPSSVSDLLNQSEDTSSIYWTWTNPTDDFNHTVIYFNDVWQNNTSNNFVNATGLNSDTSYTIKVYTADELGNINDTDVINVASTATAPDTSEPSWDSLPTNQTIEFGSSLSYDVSATDETAVDSYFLNDTFFTINEDGLIENLSVLRLNSVYNLNVSVNDTSNNINSSLISIIIQDTINPTFDEILSDFSINFSQAISIDVNATDLDNLTYHVDNVNFSINSATGVIENLTLLPVDSYDLNISVNDTTGNINDTQITITVLNNSAPQITLTTPSNESTLEAGTTEQLIELLTNSVSVCRYNISSVPWENMTELTNTSDVNHNYTIVGLTDSTTYDLFFLCENFSRMLSPYHFQFSIGTASSGGSSGGGSSGGSGGSGSGRKIINNLKNPELDEVPPTIEKLFPSKKNEEKVIKEVALFDIGVEFTETSISENNELLAKISLVNFGSPEDIDVNISYLILDKEGNILYQEFDVVTVDTQTEFLRSFDISNLTLGDYTLQAHLFYAGQVEEAKTEGSFDISAKVDQKGNFLTGAFINSIKSIHIKGILPFILFVLLAVGGTVTFYLVRKKSGKKDFKNTKTVKVTENPKSAILTLTTLDKIQNKILNSIKKKPKCSVIYVTLGITNKQVRNGFKRKRMSSKNIFFIDSVAAKEKDSDVIFVSPGRLELMDAAINSYLKAIKGNKLICIDSFSTLLNENSEKRVTKFLNKVATSSIKNKVPLEVYGLKSEVRKGYEIVLHNLLKEVTKK
jgi:hypothetical protein